MNYIIYSTFRKKFDNKSHEIVDLSKYISLSAY